MRVFVLTAVTMMAFAMNSVLNRAAVDGGHADASGFALVRVLAGVVVLVVLMRLRGGQFSLSKPKRWGGGVALALYMAGFSWAYVNLDAGLGALILFGTVQISLFAHSALTGAPPTSGQITGASIAFAGLLLALWPTGEAGSLTGAALMVLAGLGWAGYTVAGRGAEDPVAVTGSHFLLCLPLLALALIGAELQLTKAGWALAILSGGVTSGLGYALWYHVLPDLPGARAAIVQLSVPVIAILLGAALLGEAVSTKIIASAALVVGGIAFALTAGSAPAGRK